MKKKPEPKKKKSKNKRQGHNRNHAQSVAWQMTKKMGWRKKKVEGNFVFSLALLQLYIYIYNVLKYGF